MGNDLGYVRMEMLSRAVVFHGLYGEGSQGSKYVQGSWGKNMDFQPFLFRSAEKKNVWKRLRDILSLNSYSNLSVKCHHNAHFRKGKGGL